jgi:hypothetical protein
MVNLLGAYDAKPDIGVLQDHVERSRALSAGESLGVVDANWEAGSSQDYRRGDNRPCPWTASSLIDAGDPLEACSTGNSVPPLPVGTALSEPRESMSVRREG